MISNSRLRSGAIVAAFLLAAALAGPVSAEVEMAYSPVFISTWGPYHTGVGWGDFDGNGWLDLFVSNGIDVSAAQNVLYYNYEGELESEPGWISDDYSYSDNVSVADFDNDGNPGVVVACLGSSSSLFADVPQLLYWNDGSLSTTPQELRRQNAFSCASGDTDNDGDIDIGFAVGANSLNPAGIKYRQAALFENVDGQFDTIPVWESDSFYIGIDIAFGDVDADGDLDMAVGARNSGVMIFYNDGGVFEQNPSWHDGSILGGRQIAFGDVDNDGYPELAVAAMSMGYFVYDNLGGTLETSPSWLVGSAAEPSAVGWADVDADGDLDLAVASWYGEMGIFENVGGTLNTDFSWRYTGDGRTFWCQNLAWADYDADGLVETTAGFTGDGIRRLYDLGRKAIQEVLWVEVDGSPLSLAEYCYDRTEGWVSLGVTPGAGVAVEIGYVYTTDPDLAVTTNTTTWVFENQHEADPNDVNVLLLMDNNYGANYCVQDANLNIRERFESWGWNITVTALSDYVTPCGYGASVANCPTLRADVVLSEVDEITKYDALILMPGAAGMTTVLYTPEAIDFIQMAVDSGLVVAAWCRSVRVLAGADLIDGLDVVGHADYEADYIAAGATYLGADHPPVIQGNIITSVRSRFYRTEMCEAIKSVIDNKLPPTVGSTRHEFMPTPLDSVTITAFIADYGSVASAELYVDTGTGFFSLTMYDDGMHHDAGAGDSLFGALIPPVSEGTEVLYYIHVTDDGGRETYDPGDAPIETYSYTCTMGYTSAGSDINVVMADGQVITFASVISPGITTITEELSGPEGPEGYTVYPSEAGIYYNIETTASYEGDVEVCLIYDEELLTRPESWLTMWHHEGDWVNIGFPADTAANSICAVAGSLSPFIIAEEFGCCGQYTGRFTGNCNCSEDGKITLSDISRLIDRIFVSKVELCCEPNGNVNGSEDGKLTLSDVTRLIDHVFISKDPTAECL